MELNFDYADSKTAVVDLEVEGQVHRAVLTDDEKNILVYYAQENYPRWAIYTLCLKEYIKIIKSVPWIKNNLTDDERELLDDLKKKAEVK